MSNPVSCKELFDIFDKVGGKLECNYDKLKCTLLPKNVSCIINSYDGGKNDGEKNDGENLDRLVLECFSIYSTKYISFLPLSNKNNVHFCQKEHTAGFIIEYNKNNN
jgi:hypothetical protein